MEPTGLAQDVTLTRLTDQQIARLDEHTTDAYLDHTRRCFLRADRQGPDAEIAAGLAYAQLDRLLEHRLRIPHQPSASVHS